MSKSEKCKYAATRAQKLCIVVEKPAIKCKKEHKIDHSVMLQHRQATKMKKSQNDVLKNKNCSNVNMCLQKPSYSDVWLKKSALKYKYKKHHEQVICQDKKTQETDQFVCEGQKSPSTQFYNRQPVTLDMKNKDVWLRKVATETKSGLCNDKQCKSTRCFKKFTRYTQSPVRPKYTDDKNFQFM